MEVFTEAQWLKRGRVVKEGAQGYKTRSSQWYPSVYRFFAISETLAAPEKAKRLLKERRAECCRCRAALLNRLSCGEGDAAWRDYSVLLWLEAGRVPQAAEVVLLPKPVRGSRLAARFSKTNADPEKAARLLKEFRGMSRSDKEDAKLWPWWD